MEAEVGEAVVKAAAGNIDPYVGSPLRSQWDIQRRHLEAAVRDTVTEFERRVRRGPGLRNYLATAAVTTLAELAERAAREARRRSHQRLMPAEEAASIDNLERLVLHLEGVAESELRVLMSSATFADVEPGAAGAPAPLDRSQATAARCVVDTNVYLHCRRPDEVPWQKVLDLDPRLPITIVVPPVVIRELDRHKWQHPSQKVRDWAGERVRWLTGSHAWSWSSGPAAGSRASPARSPGAWRIRRPNGSRQR